MKSDWLLVGIICICLALLAHRWSLVDRRFWIELAPLLAMAAVVLTIGYRIGGEPLIRRQLSAAVNMTTKIGPALLLIFVTMGGATVLISLYQHRIIELMSGGNGLLGSLAAAFIIPGSMTSMPVVRQLWESGGDKTTLIVFLLSSRLISIQILLMFQPLLGWRLTFIQYFWGALVAVSLAGSAWLWLLMTR